MLERMLCNMHCATLSTPVAGLLLPCKKVAYKRNERSVARPHYLHLQHENTNTHTGFCLTPYKLHKNVKLKPLMDFSCVFFRYGRVESVKVLPKRGSEGGVAAFVDFVDIKSAQKAHNAINKMGDRDLRTDYNEPGTIPSAARGLDDSLSLGSRGRDVSGFTRAAGGAVYGPPTSLHSRDGRYERRLDG